MKKTLLAILATVAMVACSNDEIVREAAPEAIGFDNAFINNSTRSVNDPSLTIGTLEDFAVYGFVENAVLFNGNEVAKNIENDDLSQAWKYAGTQYWIAGANYDFYAVAPYNGNWAIKTGTTPASTGAQISFTNVNGTQDLLYSGIVECEGEVSGNDAVAFTFKHILSKVKFSFENGYNASTATIRVRDIKITNAYATGVATLGADAATWDEQDGVITDGVAFGNAYDDEATDAKESAEVAYAYGDTYESLNERFLIPSVSRDYTVSFVVDLYINDQLIDVNAKDNETGYEHTATVTFAPQAGHSYDIKATINATNIDPNHAQEPIEFTVTPITDWGTTESVEGGNDDEDNVVIN